MFDQNIGQVEVAAEDELRLKVAWPCICHAMQQARAALMLLDAGLPFPAESNTRIAFEHAVTAQWVLLTGGGEHAVHAEVTRQLVAHAKDVATFVELPPGLGSAEPGTSDARARGFQKLCDRFSPASELTGGPQRHLYALYRDLSASVHVTVRTWQEYFTYDDDAVVNGLRPQGGTESGDAFDVTLAIAVFLSLGALEEIRSGQPHLCEVQDLAEKFAVPFSLRADDQEPNLQPPSRP